MPARSPADATRFTSTGPHAGQNLFTASTNPAPAGINAAAGGGPGGETPQQRIARLREGARKHKMEKITVMDKLYVHGRVWADRAHRAVAFGLIGVTFLCGGVTILTVTEMIIINRRLKREYAEEAKRLKDLDTATRLEIEKKALIAAGDGAAAEALTPEEIARGKGIVANLKGWALAGLTPVEEEYKSRFDKEGGADVVIEGAQTKWLPTKEGRVAEGSPLVPEPGKFEERREEKLGGGEGKPQGRGVMAGVMSWFGR
ncbi:hypothetical protein DFH27DRAFT_602296 [Peziza echinospora]|nr:hypothetical protein DFH27DRAFT_602296 [Peziza echinospora]